MQHASECTHMTADPEFGHVHDLKDIAATELSTYVCQSGRSSVSASANSSAVGSTASRAVDDDCSSPQQHKISITAPVSPETSKEDTDIISAVPSRLQSSNKDDLADQDTNCEGCINVDYFGKTLLPPISFSKAYGVDTTDNTPVAEDKVELPAAISSTSLVMQQDMVVLPTPALLGPQCTCGQHGSASGQPQTASTLSRPQHSTSTEVPEYRAHSHQAAAATQDASAEWFSAAELRGLTISDSSNAAAVNSSPRLPELPQEEPQDAPSQGQLLQFVQMQQQIQALQTALSAARSTVGQQQQRLHAQQQELETLNSQLAPEVRHAEVSAQQLASREQHMRAELLSAMHMASHAGQDAAESKAQLQDARQQVVLLQQQLTATAQAAEQQEKEMQDKLSTVAAEHVATMAQLSTCMCRDQHQLYATQHELQAVRLELELAVDHAAFSEQQLVMTKQQLYAAQHEAGAACARVADLERMLFGVYHS